MTEPEPSPPTTESLWATSIALFGCEPKGDKRHRYNSYDGVTGKRMRTARPGLPMPKNLRCSKAREPRLSNRLKVAHRKSEACMSDIVEHIAAESNVRMKLQLKTWRFGKRAAQLKAIDGLRKSKFVMIIKKQRLHFLGLIR